MKFHERFDIPVSLEESQQKFINRFEITIVRGVVNKMGDLIFDIEELVSYRLGDSYYGFGLLTYYIGKDFNKCLQVIEAIYHYFDKHREYNEDFFNRFNRRIEELIYQSEVNLGIHWKDGMFTKTGALLLDEHLVNEPLEWLRQQGYESVCKPFEKGLGHYLETDKRPEVLADVITDVYEALEALAKKVTSKERDLSTNQQLFIKKVKASTAYKKILKEYISYANEFRHAAKEGKPKPGLTQAEVESFIYLTGVFIRLVMQSSTLEE